MVVSGLDVCNSNNWGLLAFGVCLIKAKKENYECDHVAHWCNYESGINVEMMFWLNYHCCCWIKQFHFFLSTCLLGRLQIVSK